VSSSPLLAATLGFIAAISKTILAIATIGLIDTGDVPPEPPTPRPGDSWLLGMALQEKRTVLDPMKICIHAFGAGLC
jgi:hypothetical protein